MVLPRAFTHFDGWKRLSPKEMNNVAVNLHI